MIMRGGTEMIRSFIGLVMFVAIPLPGTDNKPEGLFSTIIA